MSHMLLKIRPVERQVTIAFLERVWKSTFPDKPFPFSFLDEDLAAQYESEQRWSRILTYSSLLAILIACMGLFGLATLLISMATVSYHSIRAATMNPVKSLRYE